MAKEKKKGLMIIQAEYCRFIVKEYGVQGLFAGVVPRIGLGIWQTLFMVTGAKLFKEHVLGQAPKK